MKTMVKIEFDSDFPVMLSRDIESLLEDKLWILPTWMQRLYVGWQADNESDDANMRVDKDYRFARLTICGHFLTNSPIRQHEILYHELIHCQISPIADYAKEVIDIYCSKDESPKTNELLHREITRKNEAITQDFAYQLADKFYK